MARAHTRRAPRQPDPCAGGAASGAAGAACRRARAERAPRRTSRGFFSMARPCSGMSGRDQASGAGERSSVFVSPVTLKTVRVCFAATSGRLVNHSASAHDCITDCATLLPALPFSSTSWKASNMRMVFLRPMPAVSASSGSSRRSTSVEMLYPPCMVPSSSVACLAETTGEVAVPLAMALRKPALTYADSSTPGGTRWLSSSRSSADSSAGGSSSSLTSAEVRAGSSGLGTMPMALRSSTCLL